MKGVYPCLNTSRTQILGELFKLYIVTVAWPLLSVGPNVFQPVPASPVLSPGLGISYAHWNFQLDSKWQLGWESIKSWAVLDVISAPPVPQLGKSSSLSQTISFN